MREQLAEKYIRGHGIEIGGLHYPTKVPPGCIVDYVDRPLEIVKKNHGDVMPQNYRVIEDDAESLKNFTFNSLDFLIANHVFEHLRNPVWALDLWSSVLRQGGVIYMALPNKDFTFDKPRAITSLEHVVHDWKHGPDALDREHYREWFSVIDKISGQELDDRVEAAFLNHENIHFHVWDLPAMREFMDYCCPIFGLEILEGAVHGAEVIWILKKR